MSKNINGIISWLRGWFDDIYLLKSEAPSGSSNSDIVNVVYPLGCIYMSVNDVNPALLFGGNWEQIKDRFLLSKGDTYTTNCATGGEASHTLNINEMPSHTHTQNSHSHGTGSSSLNKFLRTNGNIAVNQTQRAFPSTGSSQYPVYASGKYSIEEAVGTAGATATNQNTGGGQAHNNMPPYLVVNVWKRVPYYYNASTVSWNVTSVSNNIGRKCYKNINAIPNSDYFTVECIMNIASIGKWFSCGLCLTNGEPVDNTTTSSENYGKKVIVGAYSSSSSTDNAPIKGTGGINLDKNTDYLLKFTLRNKNYFNWQISDLNGNILNSGSLESDVSNYTHLSFSSFEGVNISIREFKVY